jgi:iron-sulfur cluster insertion protein
MAISALDLPAGDFSIAANAARRIAKVTADEPPGTALRITVSGGGCSGFQYRFDFDAARHDDDRVFERDGATVVIDEASLDLVRGSEIVFLEDLAGAFFQVRNPQAASSCGCGMSFSLA